MSEKKRRGRPPGIPNPGTGRPPAGDQPKRQVSWRLRPDLLDGIDRLAADGASKTAIIEAALDEHLALFLPGWRK